jgi:hypothetical protein
MTRMCGQVKGQAGVAEHDCKISAVVDYFRKIFSALFSL